MSQRGKVAIIGGGLAGLACAGRLADAGRDFVLLESSDQVGGRVRTDEQDGFLFDRGFQVFLSAYPTASKLLDLEALDLRAFNPGALVFADGKRRRMMDVFRSPRHALSTALQPIGTLKDKLLVGKMRCQARRLAAEAQERGDDYSTEEYLRRFGFSPAMIDGFFRPFYGGIFLERELRTSSRMFAFTFDMFARGFATVPTRGMQEIPKQLARRLPPDCVRLNTSVVELSANEVTIAEGEKLPVDTMVIATDQSTAQKLLSQEHQPEGTWRSVTNLYYSAPSSPFNEAIIALNAGSGLVNNVCAISDVAPSYAPPHQSLLSVSVLGTPDLPDLPAQVRNELSIWFGPQVEQWHHLRTDRIPRALPEQLPKTREESPGFRAHDGIFVCGDHCTSASIEGALTSGLRTADAILAP